MSDLGLRYGEEFRPIRELVGRCRAIGRTRGLVGRDLLAGRANMLCTRFSSTERFKFSPPVRQRLKVVRLG